MIHVQRIGRHNLELPRQAHATDAGFDLRSSIDTVIKPGQLLLIPSGFAWEIPDGWVGIIKDRSGIAVRASVSVRAGVVDSGYRGEVRIALRNESGANFAIHEGDRIAQMVLVPYMIDSCAEVAELATADRGDAGFGSTGV